MGERTRGKGASRMTVQCVMVPFVEKGKTERCCLWKNRGRYQQAPFEEVKFEMLKGFLKGVFKQTVVGAWSSEGRLVILAWTFSAHYIQNLRNA